jgi:DNA-binding NarL/FixJ family response regulator
VFRIIIIDDNTKLREQIKRLLISELPFLDVAGVSDEKQAFLEFGKKRSDLVLIDIRLAAENGLKLIKKIKLQYPFIPLVINTNNDSSEYRSEAASAGADYFLSKKTNTINELVSLIESIFLRESEDTSKTYECS